MRIAYGLIMVKISDDVKTEFEKTKLFMLATASKNGMPNVVPVGMVMLQSDDETVWIVDNFMNKTLANVKENPHVAFSLCNQDGKESYQIKGTVTIENSGADYEKAVEIAHKRKETLPAKNLLKINMTEIYFVSPGPKAGQKL